MTSTDQPTTPDLDAPARSTYTRHCSDPFCPGHLMCFACRTDVCTEPDCAGCACGPEPCAWASYKPDCEPSDPEWPPDMVVGLDRTLRLVGGAK